MTSYEFEDSELEVLQGKTVLIVGAATGIGRATVLLAHSHGANVAIGDWNEEEGQSLASSLKECDISTWNDVLSLFEAAWETFGQIDVVLANAGIHSEKRWLADAARVTEKLVCPDMNTIRVNLDGMIYMTNCVIHYFARRPQAKIQLVFTGSAAR
ncbi:hypothetical protein H2200_011061 [Cladophialophora chaetospira]|uniref:Uncharacterized protein n=1 Tax=Cladophialophora chaetospira TaxID=386627 RepID=A0AA38WZW8_9EURO|nr:hypothetical protein H2200_011061 [Cladophialophora chaetospira]